MSATEIRVHPTVTDRLDAHGNPMRADADTVARYDEALDHLLRFRPEVVDVTTELVSVESPAPMAAALGAYLHLFSTDPADLATARTLAAAVHAGGPNEREQHHAAAIDAWTAGDWHGAARRLDDLLQRWPADLLALMIGHQLDFFVGDSANLRDRVLRSRLEVDPRHPHHGFVDGMAAFGLEESGHYEHAEAAGLAALAANPDDVWALHAVAHTYEMTGQIDRGIRLMVDRVDDWGAGNLFTVHNWWHLALYHLEAGQIDRTLEIFDAEVLRPDGEAVLLELVDAAAMLWRLRLDGVDVGDRFDRLADRWAPKALDEPWYAFNDLHATVAAVGAGRLDDARAVVARMERWLAGGHGSNAAMTAEIGLPASRGIVAFAEGRWEDVIAELAPIRRRFWRFGGSHAQRDLLARTLLVAAQEAGCHDMARSLTAERLGVRDTNVWGWVQRARALATAGDAAGSAEATANADAYRARFAAAT